MRLVPCFEVLELGRVRLNVEQCVDAAQQFGNLVSVNERSLLSILVFRYLDEQPASRGSLRIAKLTNIDAEAADLTKFVEADRNY